MPSRSGGFARLVPESKTRAAIGAAVAEVGPEEDGHLGWAQAKLAELGLQAVLGEVPADPDRLEEYVIEPELKVKEVHPAPMDKRSLLDSAKLPAAQPTPASRTSSGG